MVQLTHRSLVTLIGAIIGFISLFLPWVVSSASGFGLTASEGLSPAQLVASLFSSGSSSDPTDPAIAAWEQSAVVGYWLWLLGSVILAVGCLLAAIQVLSGSGSAGVVMLVGSGMGGAGIASFSATFPTSLGVQLSIGPTYGLGIAILASVVTLVSLFIKDTPLHVPVAGASPTAPTSATSRFCPTCGQLVPARLQGVPEGRLRAKTRFVGPHGMSEMRGLGQRSRPVLLPMRFPGDAVGGKVPALAGGRGGERGHSVSPTGSSPLENSLSGDAPIHVA